MEAYLLDWANLLLRWAHVVVAIAWIGSSFYFVWLDNSLTPPHDEELKSKGVGGELWAVHGGGFYQPLKYAGAPARVPPNLHWFYWESYATWLTGFALFTLLYLYHAGSFLIDRTVFEWSAPVAAGAALGFLGAFWLAYDWICRGLGQGPNGDRRVAVCVLALVVLSSWAACQLFAGRAAFLLVGAMLATAMSANVFFWIIPGQRRTVAALGDGRRPDPADGLRGKQRSVHNTYFTLPVLLAMLSNHYSFAYGHPHNWLVLVLLMLAGALIRHFFVARHKTARAGQPSPWGWAVAGLVLLVGVVAWLAPAPQAAQPSLAAVAPVGFAEVRAVIEQRCTLCHNAQVASKNVALHEPELVARHALQIYQQVVALKLMPLNNATGITDAERALIGRWYEAGAPTE